MSKIISINNKLAFQLDCNLHKRNNSIIKIDDDAAEKTYHDSLHSFFHGIIIITKKEKCQRFSDALGITIDKNKYWKFQDEYYLLKTQNSWELQNGIYTYYSLRNFLLSPIDFWFTDLYQNKFIQRMPDNIIYLNKLIIQCGFKTMDINQNLAFPYEISFPLRTYEMSYIYCVANDKAIVRNISA